MLVPLLASHAAHRGGESPEPLARRLERAQLIQIAHGVGLAQVGEQIGH